MANQVLTYSPADVTISISGYTLTGILSVDLIWNSRPFTLHKGIRGTHTRVFNPDLAATIRLEVLQTSITNQVLMEILQQDRRNMSARLSMTVKDTGGLTQYQSSNCYIPAYPGVKLSNGFENRTWDIDVLTFQAGQVGGNPSDGFDVFASVKDALSILN